MRQMWTRWCRAWHVYENSCKLSAEFKALHWQCFCCVSSSPVGESSDSFYFRRNVRIAKKMNGSRRGAVLLFRVRTNWISFLSKLWVTVTKLSIDPVRLMHLILFSKSQTKCDYSFASTRSVLIIDTLKFILRNNTYSPVHSQANISHRKKTKPTKIFKCWQIGVDKLLWLSRKKTNAQVSLFRRLKKLLAFGEYTVQ